MCKRLLSWLRRLTGDNVPQVRIAMVGATTSGKTYLLQDVVAALQYRMGYTVTNVPGFLDFNDLKRRTTTVSGAIERSHVYACRTHYAATLSLSKRQVARVEFLDVPGECFDENALTVFKHIKNQLLQLSAKRFLVRSWQRDRQSLLTVHTMHDGEVAHAPEDTATADRYRTNDEVVAQIMKQGYTATARDRYVNGRYLITHFFDFVTDTALNAVVEAWPLIGRGVSEALGSELTQEAVANIHIRNFYYIYFTYAATDVVFCDKCALPVSERLMPVADATSTTSFYDMLSGTMALTADAECPAKRWYLAFKGMDSIIPQQLYRAVFLRSAGDANLTYSLFTLLLARAVAHRALPTGNPDDVWRWLTARDTAGIDRPDEFKAELTHMASTVTEDEDAYFKPQDTYVVNSTDHNGSANGIGDHLTARIYSFAAATHLQEHGTMGTLLAMPPHVYFTATPIDTSFKVYGHASDILFKGATRPIERLAFGARQLITDVLTAARVKVQPASDNAGEILRYCMGQ